MARRLVLDLFESPNPRGNVSALQSRPLGQQLEAPSRLFGVQDHSEAVAMVGESRQNRMNVPANIEALIRWRDELALDWYGDDLVYHLLQALHYDKVPTVPTEHEEALRLFRSYDETQQEKLIRSVVDEELPESKKTTLPTIAEVTHESALTAIAKVVNDSTLTVEERLLWISHVTEKVLEVFPIDSGTR